MRKENRACTQGTSIGSYTCRLSLSQAPGDNPSVHLQVKDQTYYVVRESFLSSVDQRTWTSSASVDQRTWTSSASYR